jgi:RNA polymerase sigma-70 factor (ECF subfamily)
MNDFATQVERHRRELRVHCYRMMGSYEDAEDMVQETFLRAWRHRGSYAGSASLRAWLYGIATNTCLDALRKRRRVAAAGGVEVSWLQPFPDELLDPPAAEEEAPDAVVVDRETIELAFLVAIQHLPPRQRAVLLARDVMAWSAAETGELLDISVPAVNSALQRAHTTMKEHLPERRTEWSAAAVSADEEDVLRRYMEAHDHGDANALAGLLGEEMRFTMPPQPVVLGAAGFVEMCRDAFVGPSSLGHYKLVPTRANRQPAAANYVKAPGGDRYRALALDVLRIEHGRIVEVTTFEPHLFAAFGLPEEL